MVRCRRTSLSTVSRFCLCSHRVNFFLACVRCGSYAFLLGRRSRCGRAQFSTWATVTASWEILKMPYRATCERGSCRRDVTLCTRPSHSRSICRCLMARNVYHSRCLYMHVLHRRKDTPGAHSRAITLSCWCIVYSQGDTESVFALQAVHLFVITGCLVFEGVGFWSVFARRVEVFTSRGLKHR